jgi:hypothetical protein
MNNTNNELKYAVTVEPALFRMFDEIAADMHRFGITGDDFVRAIWTWADVQMNNYTTAPDWLISELEAKRQKLLAANTIEGEAGP